MSELVVRSGNSLPEKIQYAQALAQSNLLPASYRQQPANVLLAIELGESLGLVPIQAINSVHVIEGKPSASADLIAALIRRAGHKLRIEVDDEKLIAVATLIRKDDPDFPFVARWDMKKAQLAGLANKGNWKTAPGQMLRNRSVTEVARMGASDVLHGVVYTPEELGVETDSEGTPLATPPIQPPADALINQGQLAKLKILISELNMDRERGLDFYERVIGRRLETSKELTKAEASQIIDALVQAKKEGVQPDTGEVIDAEVVPQEAEAEALL